MIEQKNILLCVTGGIAVYKAAALTSRLTQRGANVKVMMSEAACKFVTPLTFQALSRHDVYVDTFEEKNAEVIAHIDLADWADLVLVAPATANTIGKLANGIADNMITTTLLATRAPVWLAPAMNVHMYEHPTVCENMERLARFGYQFIEPSEGHLACGYVGKGRLEEPENIVTLIEQYFSSSPSSLLLKGKKVLVTAGPTREKIDPVRFFSNRSTGKMGYAIAETAAELGAEVTLISGPTNLPSPRNVETIRIESAQEMYEEVIKRFSSAHIVIKSAAVADYRPKYVFNEKMKKKPGDLVVELERTIDILKALGEQKTEQFLVGFAAETEQVEEYALQKLQRKNLDMIVANNVAQKGAGFASDTNIVTIFKRDGSITKLPLLTKKKVAEEILKEIAEAIG
ncbi:bifunctional phosphopantothenoylcysteine decarboxylase/phosphopantothenate--cysteine ligase CoaBC [Anoxybacillus rupiensis]|uniref:Coenzyme A biosynthesis bifunctional protein CoaBC n=1 Tax=Anoxybacteroides rupiense TaxID=311460 RepID=A0ABT5W171_9BACL|nr:MULTISPECIES: bifunctional phosphopantothenoylcysteine decarboxylase/phosphopantothenate--cysteine ligase CoaBC [Anoxybacillus]MDE8563063.1 bifunctional phosphopantothenoylcysteine decarboxylase/phosphopantothenate--cysteine ligase CoaBC [Anoxybacillus rupiensis]QHC03631.1 bifunctional phosphopantothenoylcysteine decarboxylase/phosphopantothenate--cysteine ligase CoaBC [Anoxybacillus sp. PDR2]